MPGADDNPPAELRELACEAARVAGRVALDGFGGELQVDYKADQSEVTQVDRAAEAAAIEHLRKRRPGDGFLGEESGYQPPRDSADSPTGVAWVIDPIDGTRNFCRSVPLFASSVAAMADGRPLAGAVFDPVRGEMFSAGAGAGAWLGDSQLSSLATARPDAGERDPVVAIPSHHSRKTAARVQAIIEHCVIRNLGCTTLHMAWVAAGRLDAALMNNCKLWDIAAGWVIVREAGGIASDLAGASHFPLAIEQYASRSLPTLVGSAFAHAELVHA